MANRLAVVGSLLLAVSGIASTGAVSGGQSAPAVASSSGVVRGGGADKPLWAQAHAYWSTTVAPSVDQTGSEGSDLKPLGAARKMTATPRTQAQRGSTGFPPAAAALARREQRAARTDVSPRASMLRSGADPVTHARLLTLLVQFDPDARDDFSGWQRPSDPFDGTECVTEPAGTLLSGPRHNAIPNPATVGTGRDNHTLWIPHFRRGYYKKILFSESGYRKRVRPELGGGVDLRGLTVRNHYAEMSDGRYLIGGKVTRWLTLPHSEAWYSADSCDAGPASDIGHPDNPRGTGQMVVDAVNALHASDPSFPFADFDQEDQGDVDGDGNLFEPDGVLDHVLLIHAGVDQAAGGGAEASYAEWSSSQVVDPGSGGYEIPGVGLRVFNYTTQPENAGIGVISHEYGHDLGLPDLYDSVDANLDTDVGWWDLMSTGSHSGKLFQTLPTHMGAWSKYVLGWIDPQTIPYGARAQRTVLGQAARVPSGTQSAVKVELPDKTSRLTTPHSGDTVWWSNRDQNSADVKVSRQVDVPDGSDVRFWMWNDYTLEEFWDYGFVEVSADAGATWTQLEVHAEDGSVVSTNEDPNGNLADYYGGLENGLTGDSGGWRHEYVDLTPYAGTSLQVRLRYATDTFFTERGWFADDFSLTADGTEVWADDLEGDTSGWTPEVGSWTDTTGEGWVLTNGTLTSLQYYLVEWRTPRGFDRGLHWAYNTRFDVGQEWRTNRLRYNAPGMLVWYRDARYTANDLGNHLFEPPSVGSKGTLLLVDAHYQPARLSGAAADAVGPGLHNLSSRAQASDVAFGPTGRYPFTYCVPSDADDPYAVACNRFGRRHPRVAFTDAVTWYPGLEYRPDLDAQNPLYYRDADASTVVPAKGMYTTRIVDAHGKLLPDLFGIDLGDGQVTGTGNPRDGRPATDADPGLDEDLSLGVRLRWVRATAGSTKAVVKVRPGYPG